MFSRDEKTTYLNESPPVILSHFLDVKHYHLEVSLQVERLTPALPRRALQRWPLGGHGAVPGTALWPSQPTTGSWLLPHGHPSCCPPDPPGPAGPGDARTLRTEPLAASPGLLDPGPGDAERERCLQGHPGDKGSSLAGHRWVLTPAGRRTGLGEGRVRALHSQLPNPPLT